MVRIVRSGRGGGWRAGMAVVGEAPGGRLAGRRPGRSPP